jgi:hypothetical protein
MIVYAGAQGTSFAAGRADLLHLAGLDVSEKQVERVTERIGQERVDQRHGQVQEFLDLPLMDKFTAPAAHPPDLAVVSMDGGRLQIRGRPAGEAERGDAAGPAAAASTAPGATEPAAGGPASEPRAGHWREDKIGLLMTMTSEESATDPCPTIPEGFVDPLRILKLARELRKGRAATEDAVADPSGSEAGGLPECPRYTPPEVKVKSMVATRRGVESFGTAPRPTGASRGVGSATSWRSSISSTRYPMSSRRRWPVAASPRDGRSTCVGSAVSGRGASGR